MWILARRQVTATSRRCRAAAANNRCSLRKGECLDQEHHGADMLGFDLTTARRDVDLLQHLEQEHDRAERLAQDLAAARRDVEAQIGLAAKATDEASRLKQEAERGAAERKSPCKRSASGRSGWSKISQQRTPTLRRKRRWRPS
jgi:hypothetical protein